MRVLVLGGTGFIGPYAIRRLAAWDHEVTVFHRGQSMADLPGTVRQITGERERLAEHADELRRALPDVVLDMRPYTEDDALAVARIFAGVARRLVAISSQDVYRAYGRLIRTEPGPPDPVPLSEDAPLRERLYPYRGAEPRAADDSERWRDDYDKIPVERVVMNTPGLPGTVLRLPAVYGPGDRQHRFFSHLKRMDDHRRAILLDDGMARWRWTYGYVEDIGDAIALAVEDDRASGRIYNVGETEALSTAERIQAIADIVGWRGEIVTLPAERMPAHLRHDLDTAHDFVTDSGRIRAELGYAERTPRAEAIRRTVEWERANPPGDIKPEAFDYAVEDAALADSGVPPVS